MLSLQRWLAKPTIRFFRCGLLTAIVVVVVMVASSYASAADTKPAATGTTAAKSAAAKPAENPVQSVAPDDLIPLNCDAPDVSAARIQTINPQRLAATVVIYRDRYGVPHIDGETDAAAIFGFAYAQAEDYFWQVEDTYIMALGRYSEVHGPRGLNSDKLNHAFEAGRAELLPRKESAGEATPDHAL
jgi:acyl-homoserine lactone acylase PvdQ